MKGWGPEQGEVRMAIQSLARGQFAYFEFVRFVHTVLYGVAFRGFADPGLYTDRGDNVGVIAPLSDNVCRMIGYWGWAELLKDTKVSKLKVVKAYETMRAIDWNQFAKHDRNICGWYFRYNPVTGNVVTVPHRVVTFQNLSLIHI